MRILVRVAYPALSLLAITALVVALQGHRRALAEYRERDEEVRARLLRLAVKDRLTGSRLPDVGLVDTAGAPLSPRVAGRRRIIWLVDPESCAGCLEAALDEWHQMLRSRSIEGLLVLSRITPRRAARWVAGAGLRTPLALDPGDELARALNVDAPFVVLVVDARALIVTAEVRAYGLSDARCRRGLFQRIATIHGG